MGALIGALATASRARSSRGLLLLAALGFGAAQMLVALSDGHLVFVMLALFATGICYTVYTTSTNAIVQLATPGFLQAASPGFTGSAVKPRRSGRGYKAPNAERLQKSTRMAHRWIKMGR